MQDLENPFITKQFLKSIWAGEFAQFRDSQAEVDLLTRLQRWSVRHDLRERAAQAAFMEEFFRQIWGYVQAGQVGAEHHFTLHPDFPVREANGRNKFADAALGCFTAGGPNIIPQVLCEFKDIRSGLDAPQRRKNDNRSPVQQGLGYLSASRLGTFGSEPIIPTWAIITDMNEFRLYWADRGDRQFLRFVISPRDLFQGSSLIADSEEARFDRFLFQRLFHRDMLTVQAPSGRSQLLRLIEQERFRQRDLENAFYAEYRNFRELLYATLLEHNGEETPRFPGTRGRLVRLSQKILDRCIFIFFCEDMGRGLRFPPQLLRDFLVHQSNDPYFNPGAFDIWDRLLSLFRAMNDGSAFGGHQINQFNGGLFAPDAILEGLRIPNSVFCEPGQGQNDISLARNPCTLLYLSAAYNYAAGWSEGLGPADPNHRPGLREAKSLGLYTLGRIFEQSITELEILEAEADERPSINQENKRKRDGVYYTPEWVVERIVAETVGARIADLKLSCGWPAPGADQLPDAAAINAYDTALREVRIVDPACGSGAFLISALRYLIDEWTALRALRRDVLNDRMVRDDDTVIRDILRRNIYGVDINAASVEITKLALWLHTARGDKPLSGLDDHIRDGNSLIGPEFYEDNLAPYDDAERERINAFDWRAAFPEVFDRGGFDAVVGNPPYVKLQNFRKVHADMAGFLSRGGRYNSTQTGNFDLYLPFIEKGISLLNEQGRLGYIAPSLWSVNDYGGGLRQQLEQNRNLYGWIDFGSHQIFEEATTYTALQFFSRRPSDGVAVIKAPKGVIPKDPWSAPESVLPYERLRYGSRWLLATGAERALIDKLSATSLRLDDPRLTRGIFVGIQTSADHIYHLTRLAPGQYRCSPKGRDAVPYDVRLEDEIMKPLVSGPEAKRYVKPLTETYLLYPYRVDAGSGSVRLLTAAQIAADYPLAWAYLRSWEPQLRARENNKMDSDDGWWGYNYPKNLDKQEIQKLIVAQTVPSLRVCADAEAAFYINNVRVNGISPAQEISLWYLLGIMNAPVADFVFRRIAAPKDGGYFEANKQFIAPLPVPLGSAAERLEIGTRAEELQTLHSARRNIRAEIERRMGVVPVTTQRDDWLFADLPTIRQLEARASRNLERAEKRAWARAQRDAQLSARLEHIGHYLRPGVSMAASFENGELRFFVDGLPVVDRVFLSRDEGQFVLAQWKLVASDFSITASTTGKNLADALRKVSLVAPQAVRGQIIEREGALSGLDAQIAAIEAELNSRIYRLYGLSRDEITVVEAG